MKQMSNLSKQWLLFPLFLQKWGGFVLELWKEEVKIMQDSDKQEINDMISLILYFYALWQSTLLTI